MQGQIRAVICAVRVDTYFVRAGYVTQRAIGFCRLVDRNPDSTGSKRTDRPVLTILMPRYGPPRRCLLAKKVGGPIDNIGSNQLFNHVQNVVICDQRAKGAVANESQRWQTIQMHIK